MRGAAALAALFGSWAWGCDTHTHEHAGGPTGSTCPSDNSLTYETFAQGFVEDYCLRCHSSERTGADRNDAPEDVNLDTLAGIRVHLDHIDEHAAAGPLATNEAMPPGNPRPTLAERTMLGQWIACGAP
jgi:uncharacterized membrane protein